MTTKPEIESLILNADDGEVFGGLRQREANLFRDLAAQNGRGAIITTDDPVTRTYKAEIRDLPVKERN